MIKNKLVLVTGCYGFVAQHLIKKLLLNNNKVIGIYNKIYQDEIFDLKKYITSGNYKIVKSDITNSKFTDKLAKKYSFNYCFHLAAISQVLKSNLNPAETFNVNIFGTINLLESFRNFNPKINFIFSSSDKVYGESNKLPYSEKTPLNAVNPYDASKLSADIICRTYVNSFNMKISITRFVNIYGPGDVNWDRIIPGTIQALIKNKKPVLRSSGNFLRDYVYIDDVIDGYIKIAKNMVEKNTIILGEAINFGTNKPIKVIEVVKKILKIYDKKNNFLIIKNKAKNEIRDQYSNYSKAKKIINWQPVTKLDHGLIETVKWYNNKFK